MDREAVRNNLNTVRKLLPEGVTLVAVSKFHAEEDILCAAEAGQTDFGESYVQELVRKHDVIGDRVRWHFIGHLQRNKVKYIVPFVHMIQSLDSVRLAETINCEAGKCGRKVECLLEVHVAAEQTKSGFLPEELEEEVGKGTFSRFGNIVVRGVMGMATNTDDMNAVRRDFARIRDIKTSLEKYFGPQFDIISMGMSDDYPAAIEEGSSMVRVGSRIFGPRPVRE